jgi:hypothetical protein
VKALCSRYKMAAFRHTTKLDFRRTAKALYPLKLKSWTIVALVLTVLPYTVVQLTRSHKKRDTAIVNDTGDFSA